MAASGQPTQDEFVRICIKILIQDDAPQDTSALREHLARYAGIRYNENRVVKLLKQFPGNFAITDDGDRRFVKAITTLGLCPVHCSKRNNCAGNCTGLHICRFYLLSNKCKFDDSSCKFGHDLTTAHNRRNLSEHFLDGLSVSATKELFQQSESRNCTTIPRICKFYNVVNGCRTEENGGQCSGLHICKHYVTDVCNFGKNCKRSHNILDSRVKELLEKHGINTQRRPREILDDLKAALNGGGLGQPALNPPPLNSPPQAMYGQRGASQPAQRAIPPQPPFTLDQDSDSDSSSVSSSSHQRKRQSKQKSQSRSGNDSMPRSQPSSSTLAKRPAFGSSPSLDTSQMICVYNLRGKCLFGNTCKNVHRDMPYQWRYQDPGTNGWVDFAGADNIGLELRFCDQEIKDEAFVEVRDGSEKVDFRMMTLLTSGRPATEVCRLSTVSSGEVENEPLATRWLWYWKDQQGKWVPYGDKNMTGYETTMTSSDIEQGFLANPDGQMMFSTMGHQYKLDFQKMYQQNIEYKTKREVRRRPEFVCKEDIIRMRKKVRQETSRAAAAAKESEMLVQAVGGGEARVQSITPPHWKIDRDEDLFDHFQLVEVSDKFPSTKKEYRQIEKLFFESMPNTTNIKSILRIQNGELWTNYENKRNRMVKRNGNKPVDERQLFHGTQNSLMEAICKQGFDFRLSGTTSGTRFGKGSYFALKAKYSDSYTERDRNRLMFVVKVLVGDYVAGNHSYTRPPSKDPSNLCSDLYDTCVDVVANPTIFVVFEFNQVYPEYVIEYAMGKIN